MWSFLNCTSAVFWTQHSATFPLIPCFELACSDRCLISVLMLSIFLSHALNLVLLLCCPLEMGSRRSWISDTDSHHSSFEYTHCCVLQRVPVSYVLFHPSSTQSPSQQQCYYCQQDWRGPIGVHCVWDIHYSCIRNYFHTLGWLWSEGLGVSNNASCLSFSFCMCAVYCRHGSHMYSFSS